MWSANAAKFSGTTVATMIAIDDAQAMIRAESRPNPSQAVTMNEALGCILAQSVVSDVDSPPHDKALMDGYAVRAADIGQDVELEVIEEVVAGEVPTRPVESGTATRIMTGAPLPQGADAVVMVERTEMVAEDRVRFLLESIDSGTAVMRRGASVRRDQVVLQPGCEFHGDFLVMNLEAFRDGSDVTAHVHRVKEIVIGVVGIGCQPEAGRKGWFWGLAAPPQKKP